MDELDALTRVCEMRAVLARAGRRDLADLAWNELVPAGVPLLVRRDALRMAGYPLASGTESAAGQPDRWAELRDFADRKLAETEGFYGQPCAGDFDAGRVVGELAAYRKIRARMEEIEAGQ